MNKKKNGLLSMHGIDTSEEIPLFDPSILENIDFSKCHGSYQPEISPINPGEGLKVRPLSLSDCDKEYLLLLKQLTTVGYVTKEMFIKRFFSMRQCINSYFVIVIEDMNRNIVIGTASTIIEYKFIHSTGLRGRIEDVVVHEEYRGRQLGKLLVDTATLLAEKLGAYKISLDCKDHMIPFYKTFGYDNRDKINMLIKRLKD